MSNYKERQKQRQAEFIQASKLFNHVEGYPYIIEEGAANLYSPIREGVLQYFSENKIQWWGGKMLPTGNTLSSQVMCVNHLFPVARDKEAVLSIVNGIRGGFTAVLPIKCDEKCDESPQYISFEVVSDEDHLNERKPTNERELTRGTQCTSVDALILAQHESGRVILILIEWKYTEVYYNSDKSAEGKDGHNKGQERQRRYNDLIEKSEQLISVPSYQGSVYYQEPFYQLMRQTLWAEQMVANKQTERIKADDYLHLHVIPKSNYALLKKKYKASDTDMETTWRNMLKDPSKYLIVSPEELLKPIIRDQKYSDLVKYLEQRYW